MDSDKLCAQALSRATRYYKRFFGPSGPRGIAPTDEAAYYNMFHCLRMVGGAAEEAGAVRWVKERCLESDGTFRVNPNGVMGNRSVYFKGWVAYSAHLSEAYDISLQGASTLAAWQDSGTGGLPSIAPYGGAVPTVTDVNATGLAALAFLVTGRMREASQAARCLARLVRAQPAPGQKFYCYLRLKDGALITELPPELARPDIYNSPSGTPSEIDLLTFCVSHDKEINAYAVLSMALVALCSVYEAGGEGELIDCAHEIYRFVRAGGSKLWDTGQTSKTLWGLALLYRHRPSDELAETIGNIMRGLCAKQRSDGGWKAPLFDGNYRQAPQWLKMAYVGDVMLALHAYQALAAWRSGADLEKQTHA